MRINKKNLVITASYHYPPPARGVMVIVGGN